MQLTYKLHTGITPEHLWERNSFQVPVVVNGKCDIESVNINGYTPSRVVDAIKSQIGIALIPKDDIIEWARNWYKRVVPHDESRDKKIERFDERFSDGHSFEDHLGFRIGFLKAMLVDMGVLKVKEDPKGDDGSDRSY